MSADMTAKSVLRVNTFISASLIIDRLFQKGDNVGLWPAGSDVYLHVVLQQGWSRLVLWVIHIPADMHIKMSNFQDIGC